MHSCLFFFCSFAVGLNVRSSSGIDSDSECSSPTVDFQTRVHRLSCKVQSSGSFKALVHDEENHQLIVGGRNQLYSLDYHLKFTKKVELKPTNSSINDCRLNGYSEDHCQNYIRVVALHGDSVLSCGTYARKPGCQYRKKDNILEVVNDLPGKEQVCSDDHRQSGAVQLIENSSSIFVGLTSSKKNGIWRYGGHPNSLSTDSNNYKFLRLPRFVGSYALDPHVYFFSRELTDVGSVQFYISRVVRVCQSDAGGNLLTPGRWLTFAKSRLKCVQPGELRYEYNFLADISFTEKNGRRHAFAVFQPPQSGPAGGAVCMYSFDGRLNNDIYNVFNGPYRNEQQQHSSVNIKNKCDKLRSETDSLTYIETANQIKQATDFPLVTKAGERLVAIAADTINHSTFVFFVASDKGTVDKYSVVVTVATSTLMGYLEREYVPVVSHVDTIQVVPMANVLTTPIYTLLIVPKQNAVFAGTESEVVRVPLSRCDIKFKDCSGCIGSQGDSSYDPYCGWCMDTQRCSVKDDCSTGTWITRHGNVSCPAMPSPQYPVTISSWSSYLDVELNESVVFNCSATGSPSPSYWWTKDGGVQYEISSPEYVIPAVQDGDGGVYECLAYNARGNTTLQTVLRVRPFLTDTASAVNVVGQSESLVLPCSAAGYPKPVITWWKGGVLLTDDPTRAIFVSQSGSLVFTSIDVGDTGMYECEAASPAGNVKFPTYLYVSEEASSQFSSYTAVEGEKLSLACSLCGSSCTVRWTKDGRSIEQTDQQILTIDNVTALDSGWYRCATDAKDGQVETFLVTVLAPPSVSVLSSTNVTVAVNGSVVLSLDVRGEPLPSVIWSKGKHLVKTGSRILVTRSSSLLFQDVQLSDAGIYFARVVSPLGSRKIVFSVSVLDLRGCPPISQTVTENDPVVFTCKYMSVSPQSDQFHSVTWSRPQLPQTALPASREGLASVATLRIGAVRGTDQGEYSCGFEENPGLSCRWWLAVTSSTDNLTSHAAACATPDEEMSVPVAVLASVLVCVLLCLIVGGMWICRRSRSVGKTCTVELRNVVPPRNERPTLASISSTSSTFPLAVWRACSSSPTESPTSAPRTPEPP